MGEITRESSCLTRDVSAEEFPHAAGKSLQSMDCQGSEI